MSIETDQKGATCTRLTPGADHGPVARAPLVHLLEAGGTSFLLDLHTNRMFRLDGQEASYIRDWLGGDDPALLETRYPEASAGIAAIKELGALCSERPESLAFGLEPDRMVDQILHQRERTILELTQQCNLRCRYCTFGGGFADHRHHSGMRMSEPVLEQAIRAAVTHGRDLDEIGLGFYGGEPLLALDSLHLAVRLAERHAHGKRLRLSITTNGALIDRPTAGFLADAGFTVLVSLDGPRSLHDRFRVQRNGEGSYTQTVRGLARLIDAFGPDGLPRLGLSMVVPSIAWIPVLEQLWDSEPWLPRSLRTSVSVVNPPRSLELPEPPAAASRTSLSLRWLEQLHSGAPERTTLASTILDGNLARLHQRPITSSPRKAFFPNGCCIPGARKVYVEADGTYRVCERVHGVPAIGSVSGGMDIESIQRLISKYCSGSFADCRDCFLISTCNLCFMHAYTNGTFDINEKRRHCKVARRSLQERLRLYARVSELHPERLDLWDQLEIS